MHLHVHSSYPQQQGASDCPVPYFVPALILLLAIEGRHHKRCHPNPRLPPLLSAGHLMYVLL